MKNSALKILKYFLNFEVARFKFAISLFLRKYSLDFLNDAGLLAAKPCSSPMHNAIKLHQQSGTVLHDPSIFSRIIDKLFYLTHTRPNTAYFVCKLSQFAESPTDLYVQVATRILRYIKNSPSTGLMFKSSSSLCSKRFCDSYWGACTWTYISLRIIYSTIARSTLKWIVILCTIKSNREYYTYFQSYPKNKWPRSLPRLLLLDHC